MSAHRAKQSSLISRHCSPAKIQTTESQSISAADDLQYLYVEPLVCSDGLDSDSDLALAQKELHGALKKLETILGKVPVTLTLHSKSQDIKKMDSSISLADLVRELRALHDASEKEIEARIGKVMTALHPLMKAVLGLTETVGGSAGILPLRITAYGLNQILEVSSIV